jgi:hypothetical protein
VTRLDAALSSIRALQFAGFGRKVVKPFNCQIVGHIIDPPEFVEQAIVGKGGLGDGLSHL